MYYCEICVLFEIWIYEESKIIEKRLLYWQICVLKLDMEISGEKANSDLFVHELECSDQVICLQIKCTDLFIAGEIPRPSKNYLLTTLQCRP